MNSLYTTLLFLSLLSFTSRSFSQLSITSTGTDFTIDFESSVIGINEGVFNSTGFSPSPVTGQIDSDGLITSGFSDGDLQFGNINTTGDFARGTSSGGVSTGGIYAFGTSAGNYSIGLQPTGGDFTPGNIVLKVINNTGGAVHSVHFTYDLYVYNDQGRSNSFNSSWSTDNIGYNDLPDLDYTSIEAGDASPAWVLIQRETSFNVSLNDGESLYLKWTGDDVSGSGSRDEFALDNITVNMSSAVLPVTWLSFEVHQTGHSASLKWSTTNEINNSHFVIEHSIDGRLWNMVGSIEASTSHLAVNNYEYTHEHPAARINYYRLIQVDRDGATDQSLVRNLILNEDRCAGITLYPNPVKDHLYINGLLPHEKFMVTIFHNSGREIIRKGYTSLAEPISVDKLQIGIYFLHLENDRLSQRLTFFKM